LHHFERSKLDIPKTACVGTASFDEQIEQEEFVPWATGTQRARRTSPSRAWEKERTNIGYSLTFHKPAVAAVVFQALTKVAVCGRNALPFSSRPGTGL
jgi:hypothetical protein